LELGKQREPFRISFERYACTIFLWPEAGMENHDAKKIDQTLAGAILKRFCNL